MSPIFKKIQSACAREFIPRSFLLHLFILLATFCAPAIARAAAVPEARHVDVVLLYTRAALDLQGSEDGMKAAANYMFEAANVAYNNSGVSANLRLVGLKQTTYTEAEYYSDDLLALSAMEEVEDQPGWLFSINEPERQPALFREAQSFREQRGADLVCLLRSNLDPNFTAGIAWVLDSQFDEASGEFERIAFNVVGLNYIGIQTFAHEVGHNLGCAHDRYTAGTHTPQTKDWSQGRFPYSYGYKPDAGHNSWGTIMSYTNNRILYYSSPNVFYNGFPTGVAKNQNYSADNVSTLNYTIPLTAAYYTLPDTSVSFAPTGGTHNGSVTVSIATTRPNSILRYTTDGSTVSAASPIYTGSLTLTQNTTLSARAYRSEDGTPAERPATATYTISLPAPVLTPGSGTFNGSVTVSIAATPDAVIRYTIDGTDVTELSPIYTGPFALVQTTTVRARAYRNGITPSPQATAIFDKGVPTEALPPVFRTPGGTYTNGVSIALEPPADGASLRYTLDGSPVSASSPLYIEPILLDTGTTVRARAFREGMTPSAEVSATYIIHLTAPVITPATGTIFNGSITVTLTAAANTTLRYTLDNTIPTADSPAYTGPFTLERSATVRARAFRDDLAPSTEISSIYTIHLAPPAISPGSGSYAGSVTVTLTAAPGSSIRYSLGSPYTTSRPDAETSSVYSSPIILVSSCILTARAYREGCEPGDPVTATFTLTVAPQAAAPVITPAGGDFTAPVAVALSSATPGASLRYTLDGSEVTPAATAYSAPFTLTGSATVRARAYRTGYRQSPESSVVFTIADENTNLEALAAPFISPNGGDYYESKTISLSSATSGATLRYTLDGSEVTPAATTYTGPFTIRGEVGSTTTVRARAYAGIRPPGEESIAQFHEATRAPEILQHPASRTANPGDSVSFTVVAQAAPTPRYQWRRNGTALSGATLATLSLTRITAANAGNYDVIVSNAGGSATSGIGTLSVRDPLAAPQIQVQPTAPAGGVREGSPATFRVVALDPNGGTLTLQWNFNGIPIPGATSAEYTLPAATADDAGTYTATITAPNGRSTTSSAAVLVVLPQTGNPGDPEPPEPPRTTKPVLVKFSATPQTVLPPKSPLTYFFEHLRGTRTADCSAATGHSVVLEVEVQEGGEPCSYVWLRNGVAVPDAPSLPSYTIVASGSSGQTSAWRAAPDFGAVTQETWAVRITNSVGTVTTRAIVLEIISPPALIRTPASIELSAGGSRVLSVEAAGEPQLYYQWFKDGLPIPFAVLSTCEVNSPGLYKVTVSNRAGEISTEVLVR